MRSIIMLVSTIRLATACMGVWSFPFAHVCAAPAVICNEWKPECQQTVTEYTLLDPTAPDAGGQDAYAKTAVAACQLLGYQTFGTGTVHMVGECSHMQQRS